VPDDNSFKVAKRVSYQVWHRSSDGFTPVALVRAGNVLAAIVLTISRTDAHWANNDRVLTLQPDARSTDIGDVIVSPDGLAYEIRATTHGLVFEPINFPPCREQMALFAEWTEDYAAAAVRDLREQFREIIGGTSAQTEPSRSANDNHKKRDSGIER